MIDGEVKANEKSWSLMRLKLGCKMLIVQKYHPFGDAGGLLVNS